MAIKAKTGKCNHDGCPYTGPLIAKKCPTHYWQGRQKVNAEKPANKAKKLQKQVVGTYMANQALTRPTHCEETGQRLPTYPEHMKRACQAHILPKRTDYGFPSVAIHPQNMIFLHPDIHTDMDNFGRDYIVKMKSLPIMRERVAKLLPFLTPDELNRLPDYFL